MIKTIIIFLALLFISCTNPNESNKQEPAKTVPVTVQTDLFNITVYFTDGVTVENYTCRRIEYSAKPYAVLTIIGGNPIDIPIDNIKNFVITGIQ